MIEGKMGVSFRVDGERFAGWSYSGFNAFRAELAKEIGLDVYTMWGYLTREEISAAYKKIIGGNDGDEVAKEFLERMARQRPWSEIDDVLVPLLNHSDCEGELTTEECAAIAPRLRQLISGWPDKIAIKIEGTDEQVERTVALGYKQEMEMENYNKTQGLLLAKAMERSAETGKPLEFY
jgi:hypothetical protein